MGSITVVPFVGTKIWRNWRFPRSSTKHMQTIHCSPRCMCAWADDSYRVESLFFLLLWQLLPSTCVQDHTVGQDRTRAGKDSTSSDFYISEMLILVENNTSRKQRGVVSMEVTYNKHKKKSSKQTKWQARLGSVWTNEVNSGIWNSSVLPLHSPHFPIHLKEHMQWGLVATAQPDLKRANCHNHLVLGPTRG